MATLHKPVIAKPLNGLKVRKEDGNYLPEDGDTVIHSTYWARREADGDVSLQDIEPVVDTEQPAKAAAKSSK